MGGSNSAESLNYLGPPLYFNLKSFLDPNFLSFIRFQCILHDWGELFSEFWNFYKLKRGALTSERNQFCRMSVLFGPPFCILSSMDANFSWFIGFQCIVHDTGVLFSEPSNFYKFKRGDLISGGSQFCRKSELFGRRFSISILKVF